MSTTGSTRAMDYGYKTYKIIRCGYQPKGKACALRGTDGALLIEQILNLQGRVPDQYQECAHALDRDWLEDVIDGLHLLASQKIKQDMDLIMKPALKQPLNPKCKRCNDTHYATPNKICPECG